MQRSQLYTFLSISSIYIGDKSVRDTKSPPNCHTENKRVGEKVKWKGTTLIETPAQKFICTKELNNYVVGPLEEKSGMRVGGSGFASDTVPARSLERKSSIMVQTLGTKPPR